MSLLSKYSCYLSSMGGDESFVLKVCCSAREKKKLFLNPPGITLLLRSLNDPLFDIRLLHRVSFDSSQKFQEVPLFLKMKGPEAAIKAQSARQEKEGK